MQLTELNHPLEKRIRRHLHGPVHEFRAVCHIGFENIAAQEMALIVPSFKYEITRGAVDFKAKLADVWKILAHARTITRVLMRIASFKAENFGRLKKEIQNIPWELYLPIGNLPKILVTSHASRLYHSGAVEETVQPVLEEKLQTGGPPQKPLTETQSVYLVFQNDVCLVSIDLAGELLYKRGFSKFTERAPLRETLAASILFAGGLFQTKTLLDPMAGSGTFSLEAAFFASRKIPGICRRFAFMEQPAYSETSWKHILKNAGGEPLLPLEKIRCTDKDSKAVKTILHNAESAGFENRIEIAEADFFSLRTAGFPEPLLWALNPPYGKRIPADSVLLYKEIGKKIRRDLLPHTGALICPNAACKKALNLPEKKSISTLNGGISVEVLFY
ncbi:MAG: hypothetical protein LBR60_07295 [Fibrobacter sp.]|jgi:putative N6-adenine-specific DNA methylase|nr:hypothetical protein [Fibrobacter sp.]